MSQISTSKEVLLQNFEKFKEVVNVPTIEDVGEGDWVDLGYLLYNNPNWTADMIWEYPLHVNFPEYVWKLIRDNPFLEDFVVKPTGEHFGTKLGHDMVACDSLQDDHASDSDNDPDMVKRLQKTFPFLYLGWNCLIGARCDREEYGVWWYYDSPGNDVMYGSTIDEAVGKTLIYIHDNFLSCGGENLSKYTSFNDRVERAIFIIRRKMDKKKEKKVDNFKQQQNNAINALMKIWTINTKIQ